MPQVANAAPMSMASVGKEVVKETGAFAASAAQQAGQLKVTKTYLS